MKPLWRFVRRLRAALFGRNREAELADELESHIQMQTDDNVRAGMSPDAARRAAVLKFGGAESIKESYRDQWGLPGLEIVFADLRYAVRGFKKSPGFTLTAITVLALGIGATTAIFSIVNTVVLKDLPLAEPDRLVLLSTASLSEGGEIDHYHSASPAKFQHWRTESGVLEDVSGMAEGVMNFTGGQVMEVMEQWQSARVTADFFHCWRIPMLLGRTFSKEEDSPNGPLSAVISRGLWTRRFAGDPGILGKTISLNGAPHTVIGVSGDSPIVDDWSDEAKEVYVPFQLDPNSTAQGHFFEAFARLKPGVTREQANERLKVSASAFRARFGDPDAKWFFAVTPLTELRAVLGQLAWVLQGAVGLVLLIAAANVANLLLARSATRRREMAIRIAIGAGRKRMIRQLLTESTLLSLVGGFFGLLIGYGGIRALLAVVASDLPLVGPGGAWVQMDWRVMTVTLAVSLLTGIAFGLIPALHGSKVDLSAMIKGSSARSAGSLRRNKTRAMLVGSQVSIAIVLLVASALMIRTFVAFYAIEPGYETHNVLTMRALVTGPKHAKSADVAQTVRAGRDNLRALPGVVAAGATWSLPLVDETLGLGFVVIGRPSDGYSGSGWSTVSPGFFEAFNIPIKRGRTFMDRDSGGSPAVAVINEAMAKQFWKDSDPLKDQILIGQGTSEEWDDEPARQIVGIVGNVRDGGLHGSFRPIMYVPQEQLPDALSSPFVRDTPVTWIIRTQIPLTGLVPVVRERLQKATGLPVPHIRSMDEVVSSWMSDVRFILILMTIFGGCALLLASIGIYGLIAYTVEQRTQEIGIRLALGANTRQVRTMVVRQGMSLTLAGVVIGLGAALALSRLMEGLLFGIVGARDPAVFVAVPVVLGAVALLAVWIPSSRATRISPMDSLRHE